MKSENRITGFVHIKNGKVSKNGQPFFSSDEPFNRFIRSLYKSLGINYPAFYKMDNLAKLGYLASSILLKDERNDWKFSEHEVGIFLANASSSLDTDCSYLSTIKNFEDYFPSPAVFVYTLPNIVIGEICIAQKVKGENTFFIQPEFDSNFMTSYVNGLLNSKKIKAAISGWVELYGDEYDAFLLFVRSKHCVEENRVGNFKLHTPEEVSNLYYACS